MDKLLVGIDLGGTNVKGAVVTQDGKILHRRRCETRADEGKEAVIGRIAGLAEELAGDAGLVTSDLLAVGVGAPGPLSTKTGTIIEAPNLPGWVNVPLRKLLQERLGVRVFVENDANAAAWGEKWAGAGRAVDSLICLTLGTGIGGGIVIDGKLLHGIDDTAAEIGHMTIIPDGPRCGCGNYGCLEALASATATARRAREAIQAGGKSTLQEMCAGDLSKITAAMVDEAAAGGDKLASEVMRGTALYLGIAIASLTNVLNPEMAVLSGGMIAAGERLFGPIRETVKKRAFKTPARRIKIVPAERGDDAGVLGAAGIALEWTRGNV